METLEATVKAAAEKVLNGTGSYIYARKGEYTLDHDKPAPHLVFFDPNGTEKENTSDYNCMFMFAEPDPETETREYRYEVTKRMFILAKRFFWELDKHGLILISNRPKEKVIKEFQSRVSGMAYQCTITTPLELDCEELTFGL